MSFKEWKAKLVTEVDDAAAWCAERALADPDDPRNEKAQKALVHLADRLRALPADHKALTELFREEQEFSNLARAVSEEPEHRYRDAEEELLRSIGFEHEPFREVDQFLGVLRNLVDETISEYRLRA